MSLESEYYETKESIRYNKNLSESLCLHKMHKFSNITVLDIISLNHITFAFNSNNLLEQ